MSLFKRLKTALADSVLVSTPDEFTAVEEVTTHTGVLLQPENYTDVLQPDSYVEEFKQFELDEKKSVAKQRKQVLFVLLGLYALGVVATFSVIFFQGFKFLGFALDADFMSWLGAAVIGELAGLLAIALTYIYKS